MIGPGQYAESLTLYDHVDLTGIGPLISSCITGPAANPAIAVVANCFVTNLRFSGSFAPIINVNVSGVVINFDQIYILDVIAQISGLKINDGTCNLFRSHLSPGGSAIHVTGGVLNIKNTLLERSAIVGAVTESVVKVSSGTILLEHSIINNLSNSGTAVYFSANPTKARILSSILRKADGFEAISADVTSGNVFIYGSMLNGSIDGDIVNTADCSSISNL